MARAWKWLKVALVAGALALAVVGFVAWWFLSSLDRRVEEAIERDGSALTGTAVRVSSVHLSLREGTGTIRGITVANPDGFSKGDAIRIDAVKLKLDLATVRKSPIVVETLAIEAPRVTMEMSGNGRTNVDALRKAVERNAASAPADPDPLKLRVVDVRMPDGHLEADTSAVGGTVEDLELNDVRLRDVGGRSGATTDVVGKAIVAALAKEATAAATRAGMMRGLDKGKEGLKQRLGEKIKGLGR